MRESLLQIALLLICSVPLMAQETELPQEARNRIDYLVGTWDVTQEVLNEAGEVVETSHAVDHIEYFLGDAVLETTVIPEEGPVRKTIRFYDKQRDTFYELSVGTEGDLYILSGGLDEYVMGFTGRTRRNGVYPLARYHHVEIEPDSFVAILEVSTDGGETWTRRSRSLHRRRTPPQ